MNNKSENALSYFKNNNCCQSVITVLSDELDLSPQQALKIGAGFGAGMGYQGRTCGAVVGAYMAIGLKVGENTLNPEKLKEETNLLMEQYNKTFVKQFGSTICKELLMVDVSEPGGLEEAKNKSLFDSQCPRFVKASVEIVEELFNKYLNDKED